LDKLGIGKDLKEIPWGVKKPPVILPPSKMIEKK